MFFHWLVDSVTPQLKGVKSGVAVMAEVEATPLQSLGSPHLHAFTATELEDSWVPKVMAAPPPQSDMWRGAGAGGRGVGRTTAPLKKQRSLEKEGATETPLPSEPPVCALCRGKA